MSKHFFQSNYKPKFDFKQTINFIQSFDKILIDKICEKYSSQLVNFPLTRSIKTFEVTNLFPRNVIFDNANTDYLFSLNENPIDFFIQKSNDFHSIKSFVSKTSIFSFLALVPSMINKSAFFSSLLITAKRLDDKQQRDVPFAGDEQMYFKFDVQK